jgi:hypothetical protein
VNDDHARPRRRGALGRGLRSTVGRESTTFGFSILVTAAFGLLQKSEGSPDVPQVFLFAVGSALSFTLLEGVLSRGFRAPMPQHDTQVQAAGTSLNVVSVVGGLGACWLAAETMSHPAVWALGPFVGAVTYLVLESVETSLAERFAERSGDPGAADVQP